MRGVVPGVSVRDGYSREQGLGIPGKLRMLMTPRKSDLGVLPFKTDINVYSQDSFWLADFPSGGIGNG